MRKGKKVMMMGVVEKWAFQFVHVNEDLKKRLK